MKKTGLFLLIALIWVNAFSQKFGISDQPDQFIKDISNFLKSSTKEDIRNTGESFEAFWESDLNENQRKQVAALGAKLKKKGYTYSHFNQYLRAIMGGAEVNGFVLEDYLNVGDKVLDKQSKFAVSNFLSISDLFLNDSCLTKTNFNSILVLNGSFKFEYIEKVEEKTRVDELLEKGSEKEPETEDAFNEWDAQSDDEWEASSEGDWEENWEEEPVVEQKPEVNVDMNKKSAVGYEKPKQPDIVGAVITFTDIDLHLFTQNDSALVEKTSGSLMFNDKLFVAKGGKVDWRTAGMDEGSCFVELDAWNFDMKGVGFKATDVKLSYPDALGDKKVDGLFEYKTQRIADRSKASFPRFMSYHSVSEYKNLGDNIQLSGGFSMEGKNINTSSVDGEVGKLSVLYEGQVRFKAKGKRFDIRDTTLSSRSVGIIIFMGRDSLIHPSMSLTYGLESNVLELRKGNREALSPFMDTYHKVEITAEKLKWDLSDSKMYLSIMSAPAHKPILVESNDYYDDNRYVRLRGIGSFHPLQSLVYYAKKKNTSVVYVSDVAKAFKKEVNTYAGAMESLARQGFVSFDRRSGKITLKRKAYFYVLGRSKKTDFDNITIKSTAGGRNAEIDLKTNNLTLSGVKRFYLNDSLVVYNEPRDGRVVIQRNRNMLLHGKLVAGKYFFICDSMAFNYDRYEIELNKIDSIQFSFRMEKKEGEEHKPDEEKELGLAVDYASGMLYIDKPNNKGTRKKNPGYPFFDAVTGARVPFSDSTVLGGVYGDDVYFHIPPFDIDSLNSVDPNKANFKGTFHSGGIFPEFDDILTVRTDKDLTFGFIHEVPEDGYPIYGKPSKFKGKIDMSGHGMHGIFGVIEHITSKLYSDDFIFYPDSVVAEKGAKVEMELGKYKETSFPQMKIENFSMKWDLVEDSLHLWNKVKTDPFNLYGQNAAFRGKFTIRENGAFGNGVVKTNHAIAQSKLFNFQDEYFTGSYTEFHVNSDTKGKPALRTTDAKLRFDMNKLEAEFGPEEEGFASTEFPFMQYKTSLGKGLLKIKEDVVEMKMEEGSDIADSYFYSTHPDQDSLVFNATHAICDLKEYKLDIEGIPEIIVGDSKVIPDSGTAHIREHADFQTLENAKLIIDTLEEYHALHAGKINILSRTKIFKGEADYSYVNTVNDTFELKFHDFKMLPYTNRKKENRHYTIGMAEVEEEDAFYISPRIQYRGGIKLSAQKEHLDFNGFVKLDLKSSDISDYFTFIEEDVDPENIQVDMTNPRDADGTALRTGLFVDESSDEIYTALVALTETDNDLAILDVKGALSYNPENNEFMLADTHKLNGHSRVGNVMVLNDSTNQIRFEGKFNFHRNDKDFQFFSAGSGEGNIKEKKYDFHTFTMLQYRLPSALVRRIADTTFAHSRDEYLAISDLDTLAKPMAEFSNDRTVETMLGLEQSTGEKQPLYEYSSKFAKTFVFSDMNLHWSAEENSLWCDDTFGLSNIGKQDINALLHGKLEIHKNSEGDEFNFLFQPDKLHWYYMSYRDNILYMISSDYEFNKYVHKRTKLEERKDKEFMIALTDYAEKEEFASHYVTKFYKEEYDTLNMDSLEIAFNKMVESFTVEKGGKEEIKDKEVEENYDGFEDLDSEDLLEKEESPEEKEDDKPKKEVKEEDDLEDTNIDDLDESDFENSSLTNTKPNKKTKSKKDKKEKEPETTKDDEEDGGFDDFGEDEEDSDDEGTKKKEKVKKEEKETPKEEDLEDLDGDLDDED